MKGTLFSLSVVISIKMSICMHGQLSSLYKSTQINYIAVELTKKWFVLMGTRLSDISCIHIINII